jgi:2'-5' RNA ligase
VRLFVAIDLDEASRLAIAEEQTRLKASIEQGRGSSLRWVKPEQMHLTLVFLGNVTDDRSPAVVDTMRAAVPYRPFDIELRGIGVFPPRGAPRVLWLGLQRGAADVIEVQRLIAARLTATGVELEQRPFQPHLTLARWRESSPADRARAERIGRTDVLTRVTVRAITLIHSQVSSQGSKYSALCEARLAE